MHIVRKGLLILITPLFPLLLFLTAFDFGIIHIAGEPAGVKKILRDSSVYQTVIPDALAQAKQISGEKTDIPLNQKAIQDAAATAFTPQVLQQSTESAIDGFYHWLNGKSSEPDFHIDLTQVKASFASSVAQAAQKQTASLPVCPAAVRGLPNDFDPFSAACLPKGVTPQQIANQVQSDVASGKGFLEHPVITANNVKRTNGQSPFTQGKLKNAPDYFQKAKKTPFVLCLLTILTALAIVFLSQTKRSGLKRAGITVLTIGVIMLVFAWVLNWGLTHKGLPDLKLDNAVLEKDIKVVVTNVIHSVDRNYWIFGGIYTVLGAAAIVGPRFIGRKGSDPDTKTGKSEKPLESTPKTLAKPPAAKVQPTKRVIKVQ